MNDDDDNELDLEGFVPDEEEPSGGLSALDNAPVQGTPAIGGLAAADPQQALSLGTQRLNQLAEIKKIREQMTQQAAIRREAMQKYTSAYETAPDVGRGAGLAALGRNLGPGMSGFTKGMSELIANRDKLAEREWARQVGGQKLRAETEQQGVVDLQNQAQLAEFGLGGTGLKSYAASKPFRATDPNDNLTHEYQNIWDMDTQKYVKTDMGVVPKSELKTGEKLRAGQTWNDPNDHSKGVHDIAGAVPPPKNMRWVDPMDTSKGAVYIGGTAESEATKNKGDYSKTGDEFLASIPENEQDLVKKIANYEINPTSLSTKGGHRERILSMAGKYNTEYDQKRYPIAQKTIQDFTTGKQGNVVRSFNVALDHLGTLEELATALKNEKYQDFNKVANFFSAKTGSPVVTDFNGSKRLVMDEVIKAIVGAGGGVTDRDEAAKSIDAANSTEQLLSQMSKYKKLFGGQIKGLKKQYESAGLTDFENRFLTPEGQGALNKVTGKEATGVKVGKFKYLGKEE